MGVLINVSVVIDLHHVIDSIALIHYSVEGFFNFLKNYSRGLFIFWQRLMSLNLSIELQGPEYFSGQTGCISMSFFDILTFAVYSFYLPRLGP